MLFWNSSTKLTNTNILVSFDNMCNILTLQMKDKGTADGIVSQFLHLADWYYNYYEPTDSTFTKHGILKKVTK